MVQRLRHTGFAHSALKDFLKLSRIIKAIMGDMVKLSAGGNSFDAYVARPSGDVKGSMIVIHEIWGLVAHVKGIADKLAAEGYVALAPNLIETGLTEKMAGELQEELFDPERRSQAQPKIRELMTPLQAPNFGANTLANVQACFAYLAKQDGVNGNVGIMGFCFGGTYSFSLAVHEPKLKVALPFYGHADFSAEELKAITCPILAFYGEKDERLMEQLPELKSKMAEAGVDFTAQVYPDCGHAFFNDTNPYAYNQAAAADAWQRTLTLLAKSFA
jgi:carboxymethylenebutenolidase